MRKTTAIACAAAGTAALAASGANALAGGGAPSAHGASTTLHIKADPAGGLKFNVRRLSAHRGIVTISMANPSGTGLRHGVAVGGNGVAKKGKIVAPGHTSTVSVRLKAGRYTFYCPVPGHRPAGMRGTLTVK